MYLPFVLEGKENQYSVAMWLVSKQQFHSLLWGNKVFFCFCKCCLYWVNPSASNSDNMVWTSNEKNAFAKNRTQYNDLYQQEVHQIRDRLLAWHFRAVDSKRMPTFITCTWSTQFILWINVHCFLCFLAGLKCMSKATQVSMEILSKGDIFNK